MNPLALLGSARRHWKPAALAAALILAGILHLRLESTKRHIARVEAQLAEAKVAIELQNAAVVALKREGEARRRAAREALEQASRRRDRVETTARKLEAPRPLTGRCETPKPILEADL